MNSRVAAQSEIEETDGRYGCERGSGLERKHKERLPGSAGQPFDGEERQQRQLSGHQELPDVRSCSLVGFAGDAKERNVSDDDSKRRERHGHRKKRARVLENCSERARTPFHSEPLDEMIPANACDAREARDSAPRIVIVQPAAWMAWGRTELFLGRTFLRKLEHGAPDSDPAIVQPQEDP